MMYHLKISHFLLLLFLASSHLHSAILCFGDRLANNSVKSCIEEERRALLSFKQDLTDPSGRLSSWVGLDCCQWEGISCDNRNGHVAKMDLRNLYPDINDHFEELFRLLHQSAYKHSCLGGKINPSMIRLKHLKYLDLSFNNFEGNHIPKFFGKLKSLRYLNVSSASFGGNIPHSLGNLSNLNYLDLSYSDLYFLSHERISSRNFNWLSGLSSLKSLNLGGLDLGQFPTSKLAMLKSLEYLDLSGIGLTGQIPNFIGNLPKLKFLSLSGNNFSGGASEEFWRSLSNHTMLVSLHLSDCELSSQLPASIGNFKNLQHLDISYNYLWGSIPESIGNLSSLETLDLYSNNMNGSIPESLGQLSELIYLDLSLNSWEGTLTESHFINLTSLKEIFLYHTPLTFNVTYDWVPPFKLHEIAIRDCKVGPGFGVWLQSQTELSYLSLRNTSISDSIPEDWFLKISSQIEYLDLSYNQFRGRLPSIQLKFPNLESISLGHNQFEGPFPLWSTNATVYDLESNLFSGPIPSNIDQLMPNLQELYLSENQLNGTIPPSICNLQDLGALTLRHNQLYGELPQNWLLKMTSQIVNLDLSHNQFRGTIPEKWFLKISSQIEYLGLSYNQFRGRLPLIQLAFPNLESISLGHNQFEGPFPLWSTNATIFDLQSNLFSGPIPSNIDQLMPNLQELYLSENQLNGTIPPSICNLQDLGALSLRNNQLYGELPQNWSMGSEMRFLDVSNNNIHGSIPASVGALRGLQVLKLNDNNFNGKIPDFLQNFTDLVSIDLGGNKFFGNIPLWIGELRLYTLHLRFNSFTGHIPESLCNVSNLHILDLSHNNFSGTIPKCFPILAYRIHNDSDLPPIPAYIDPATLTLKGRDLVYFMTLWLVNLIDLSSNHLHGEIPEEICSLTGLGTLNLSRNQLTGKIPSKIGNLSLLETLDLSHNHLSGQIPQNLSSLTFLSHLDLSYNNLTGRIPSSNQLQTLNESSYYGNPYLCGAPLSTVCPGDATPTRQSSPGEDNNKDEDDKERLWLYVSIILGFVVGFWGVCGTLLLKKTWRYAYFQFFDNISDRAALAIAVRVACWKRNWGRE